MITRMVRAGEWRGVVHWQPDRRGRRVRTLRTLVQGGGDVVERLVGGGNEISESGCMGKRDADGCAVSQLRVGELDGLWDQSWCNTVSKLVMKLDAIKLGAGLGHLYQRRNALFVIRTESPRYNCVCVGGYFSMYRHGGPPDQRSPSNPRKLSPALLSPHDAPAGIARPGGLHLASLGWGARRQSGPVTG